MSQGSPNLNLQVRNSANLKKFAKFVQVRRTWTPNLKRTSNEPQNEPQRTSNEPQMNLNEPQTNLNEPQRNSIYHFSFDLEKIYLLFIKNKT